MDERSEGTAASSTEDGRFAAAADREISFFGDRRRLIQTGVVVLLLIVAIYVLFPKVVGIQGALGKISEGDPVWIVVALGFNVLAFFAYVALFRGVVGEDLIHLDWRESYQITMAGLAATRLFSAGGAGGSCSPTGPCARPGWRGASRGGE